MQWYDLFSGFYDGSVEKLYVEARARAAAALALAPGLSVLDLPCGTGQSFDVLAPAIAPSGVLVGIDRSGGMLKRARARVAKQGFAHVQLLEADVATVDEALLAPLVPGGRVDRLHVFLGLSAFPDWERAFERLWAVLAPGGRCVVVDVHAERLGFQGRMVNLVARAELRRRTWEPLERVADGFVREELPSLPQHGGQLFLATGVKSR